MEFFIIWDYSLNWKNNYILSTTDNYTVKICNSIKDIIKKEA